MTEPKYFLASNQPPPTSVFYDNTDKVYCFSTKSLDTLIDNWEFVKFIWSDEQDKFIPLYDIDRDLLIQNFKYIIQVTNEMCGDEIRRTGASTKLVDAAIQELFTTGKTTIKDHYKYGTDLRANRNLFSRVLRRLNIEHHNMQYTLDHHTLTIKLGNK